MIDSKCIDCFAVNRPAVGHILKLEDGTCDILWQQTMGIMDPYLTFNPDLSWGKYQPLGLCHITRTNRHGKTIWQSGESFEGDYPYFSHFSDGMMAIEKETGGKGRLLVCGTREGKGILRIFDLVSGELSRRARKTQRFIYGLPWKNDKRAGSKGRRPFSGMFCHKQRQAR